MFGSLQGHYTKYNICTMCTVQDLIGYGHKQKLEDDLEGRVVEP